MRYYLVNQILFYPFIWLKTIFKKEISMISLNLPSILVPLVGLVFPAIAMASLFLYIEKEELS